MRRECLMALVLGLPLATRCATTSDEPLPAVREPAILEAQEACVAPPPPPPFQEPVEKPTDLRACLPRSWGSRTLPVEMTVVNGRVQEFRFYDQCEGRLIPVEPSLRACIASSLNTWRYATGPPCPGHDYTWTEFLVLQPLSPEGGKQGCGS
jgi:hypothetical protein